jgi:hypothetical protein
MATASAKKYTSVKRFVRKLRGSSTPEARVVIETAPGEEAQVDYGTGPMVRDAQTNEYRRTIRSGSRLRRRARTDLCGGRSAMIVPTASATTRLLRNWPEHPNGEPRSRVELFMTGSS